MSETLIDELNRRFLQSESFANYLLKTYGYTNLEDAYKAARLILLDYGDITSITKLNKITAEIARTVTPETEAMFVAMTKELDNFGASEAIWLASTLSEFAPVNLKKPAKQKTIDYINKSIMSLESGSSSIAGTWSEFTKANTDELTRTIVSQVKSGYANGDTTQQIVKRIKTATEGVSKNSIERLVRTGTNHYAQQASLYMRDENVDVIAREIPITTWDSRRSLICTSIEAKYGMSGSKGWPVGKSPIGYNPYHYGCRTKITFLPKGVELEGTRPAIEGRKGKAAEDAYDRKTGSPKKYTGRSDQAFKAEQVPVNEKLGRFILDQPIFYQNQLLGKTRAAALRRGDLDLKRLTTNSLKARSLEELNLTPE